MYIYINTYARHSFFVMFVVKINDATNKPLYRGFDLH